MPENTGGTESKTENMLRVGDPSLSPASGSHTPGCAGTLHMHLAISEPYMWAENVFRLPDKHLNLWTS